MVEKKRYVKPGIESEEALEQTSLACNASEWLAGPLAAKHECLAIAAGAADGLTFGSWCETDVTKGGNFDSVIHCDTVALASGCIVVLS